MPGMTCERGPPSIGNLFSGANAISDADHIKAAVQGQATTKSIICINAPANRLAPQCKEHGHGTAIGARTVMLS